MLSCALCTLHTYLCSDRHWRTLACTHVYSALAPIALPMCTLHYCTHGPAHNVYFTLCTLTPITNSGRRTLTTAALTSSCKMCHTHTPLPTHIHHTHTIGFASSLFYESTQNPLIYLLCKPIRGGSRNSWGSLYTLPLPSPWPTWYRDHVLQECTHAHTIVQGSAGRPPACMQWVLCGDTRLINQLIY